MGFSRQEYWSGVPFPSPGDRPNPGIEPRSPALQEDTLPSEPPRNLYWSLNPIKLIQCFTALPRSLSLSRRSIFQRPKWEPKHADLQMCPGTSNPRVTTAPVWPAVSGCDGRGACPQGSFLPTNSEGSAAAAKSLQSCPTLCDPVDSSPPGSSVPGILQARTLEWVAISFSNAWKWKVKVKSLSRADS